MRSWAVRSLLLLLLFGSVAARYQTIRDRDDFIARYDTRAAIVDVLTTRGLTVHDNPVPPPRLGSWIVYFSRPECMAQSMAMPFRLNFEALPTLQRVAASDHRYSFHYFDGSWPVQDRAVLFGQWLKQAVLSVVGASRYVPVPTAMVLAEPLGCAASPDTVDWQLVWDRDRQRRSLEGRAAESADRRGAPGPAS